VQRELIFFFKQNKECRRISNCSTLKYINRNKKNKKEGGHKPKPSRIKEENDKPKQIKQQEARGATIN